MFVICTGPYNNLICLNSLRLMIYICSLLFSCAGNIHWLDPDCVLLQCYWQTSGFRENSRTSRFICTASRNVMVRAYMKSYCYWRVLQSMYILLSTSYSSVYYSFSMSLHMITARSSSPKRPEVSFDVNKCFAFRIGYYDKKDSLIVRQKKRIKEALPENGFTSPHFLHFSAFIVKLISKKSKTYSRVKNSCRAEEK